MQSTGDILHIFEWYYGQTFIDSTTPALLIEVMKDNGDLEDFAVAPYNWMLA